HSDVHSFPTRRSSDLLDLLVNRVRKALTNKEVVSIAYLGNVVDVWEKFDSENITIDLGSDQTSLHNPWAGGYYPVGQSFEESNRSEEHTSELQSRENL